MTDVVKVSLLQAMSYRASKDDSWAHYGPGIIEMPLEHAKALGVTRRIVKEDGTKLDLSALFDERTVAALTAGGYHKLDDLVGVTQDQLLALDGIGPASYARIQSVLKER